MFVGIHQTIFERYLTENQEPTACKAGLIRGHLRRLGRKLKVFGLDRGDCGGGGLYEWDVFRVKI